LPALGPGFWAYGLTGGLAQVLATVCVVKLFQSRNFAVGITLKKSEAVLAVLVGLVLLGEGVRWPVFAAIALGVVGVVLLSKAPNAGAPGQQALFNRGVALGLGAGLLFAVSAVCYRGATLQVDTADVWLRAGVTLCAVTAAQTLGMALWLRWRAPGQISAVIGAWRVALWTGILSMAGSFGWFLAFTLQTAALVKAVGQVELLFSLLISMLVFGERSTGRELAGMALLLCSIIALLLLT
jgi:drug/metabolite transporter (DMT)-like permease